MVAALLLLALLLLALLRPISSHPFTLAALLRARSPRCAAPRLASRVTYLAVARSASTSLRHAVLRYHKHHDHDCTLADMARVADASGRPVGLVLVVLRPPASRVMSGLLRRMESSDTVRQNAMATKAHNRLWRDRFGSRLGARRGSVAEIVPTLVRRRGRVPRRGRRPPARGVRSSRPQRPPRP